MLAAWVGDCAPVVFIGDDGTIAAAHAGWSGALDGVLQATVNAMRVRARRTGARRARPVHPRVLLRVRRAELLAQFAARFGSQVTGTTAWGTPALDMPAVVAAALRRGGRAVARPLVVHRLPPDLFFSHRVRGQRGRQVMTISKRAAA